MIRQRLELGRFEQLGLAFTVITLLFALPLYSDLFASPGLGQILRLVLIVQIGPTLGLFLLGRLFVQLKAPAAWQQWFWAVAIGAAVLSVIHWAQVEFAPGLITVLLGQARWAKVALGALVAGVVLGGIRLGRDRLAAFLASLAPVFLLATIVFFLKIALLDRTNVPARPIGAVPTRQDSVYILLFDELGRDVLLKGGAIDGDRFPHIKALADEGVWFSNATANYDGTCRSIPSMVTGKFVNIPKRAEAQACQRFILTASGSTNLFTTLAGAYKISVYEEYLRDCTSPSPYLCRGVPYLISTYPYLGIAANLIPEGARIGVVGEWLGSVTHTYSLQLYRDFLADVTPANARGRVYYVHILLPHFPYGYDTQGVYHPNPYNNFGGRLDAEPLVAKNYERQVMLVDTLIGQLTERLKAQGLYDDATIIITGDHGPLARERLVDDPSSNDLNSQRPNVPLILKGPHLPHRVLDVDYQHIDFTPTVLDALEIQPKGPMDGTSALSTSRPNRLKRFMWGDTTYLYRSDLKRWVPQ